METELPPLTEALVQDLIYARCSRAKHEITVPNCGTAWGYDSDVASVTPGTGSPRVSRWE